MLAYCVCEHVMKEARDWVVAVGHVVALKMEHLDWTILHRLPIDLPLGLKEGAVVPRQMLQLEEVGEVEEAVILVANIVDVANVSEGVIAAGNDTVHNMAE